MDAEQAQVAGLVLKLDLISEEEEEGLIAAIKQGNWNTSLKRRTQHYGYEYNYDRKSIAVKTQQIPVWCQTVKQRIEGFIKDQAISTDQNFSFDQMIVNEYEPGQGISPHIDNVDLFEDIIVSVSLGSECVMQFEHKPTGRKVEHLLRRRSALLLHKEARYEWKHGIPSRKKDNGVDRSTRYSLTLRKMKV